MSKNLKKLEGFVKAKLANDQSGHDYPHIKRVLSNAMLITKGQRSVDKDVLIATCLLHDIVFKTDSPKTHSMDSAKAAEKILPKFGFTKEETAKIANAIHYHNRGFAGVKGHRYSLEERILCDADRIDSLGAVGIARMVQFCAKRGLPMLVSRSDRVNESLYGSMKFQASLAKDMFTPEGKRIAKARTAVMNDFIGQLENECRKC